MKPNKLGCYNEKVAILYLMKKGLEVFDSVQTHGTVDLMTFNPSTVRPNAGKLNRKTTDIMVNALQELDVKKNGEEKYT